MRANSVKRSIFRRLKSVLCAAVFVFLLVAAFGCGPAASTADGTPGAVEGQPELTDEVIRERINEARVWDVPEESGTAEPISWGFDEDEPKEIVVVEKQLEGTRTTIVLDIKTKSSPRSRSQRYLAGQIRTEWELQTGFVLRRWEIVRTENISMKYKNLPVTPSPTQSESTRDGR